MLKQSSILLAGLIIGGCGADRAGPDWAADCKRNFSETGREYAACMAENAQAMTAKAQAPGSSAAVTTTPEGAEVPYLEGKATSAERDNTGGGN